MLGELGRLPLSILCKERAIKFWIKIKSNVNLTLHDIYLKQISSGNRNSWASCMNAYIDNLGFAYLNADFDVNRNYFSMLKIRLRDQYTQY